MDAPQPPFSDPTQQRYELIRPLLLDPERTTAQRAQETGTHPETVGRLKRRFVQHGMLGLIPATQEVRPARRQLRVPETVVQELQRLKGLYAGFGARELARIIFHTTMYRLTGQTARRLWDRLPPCDPQNYRGLLLTSDEVRCCSSLFTSSRSKASGSNSPPTQSSISSCSGCSGSRIASSKLAYPQTPRQSSGGQARLPVRQTG